jgi:Predicted redox protein, regulator of disulfide bond formation
MTKTVLNVKGLSCPLPVLHTRNAMKNLSAGAVIEIHSTDPASVQDFDAYCRHSGSDLLSRREEEGVFTFEIRKGP